MRGHGVFALRFDPPYEWLLRHWIEVDGCQEKIRAGLRVSAEIKTGSRRVISAVDGHAGGDGSGEGAVSSVCGRLGVHKHNSLHLYRPKCQKIALFKNLFYKLPGRFFGSLGLTFLISLTAAQADKLSPPQFRATLDIPDYLFEHEESRVTKWRIEGPRAERDRFAYLILPPGPDGRERRALILVDSSDPEKAFFLEGTKLSPVLPVTGNSLNERIDQPITENARLVDPNAVITVNMMLHSDSKEQIRISFSRALNGFDEKFDIPCLVLPDVLTLSRREKVSDLVVLINREKSDFNFRPRCKDYVALIKPPAFIYLEAARFDFAFSLQRFVFHYRNYIVSIPYDLDEVKIERSSFLVTKGQLVNILNGLGSFSDADTKAESPESRFIKEVEGVQHSIDRELLAVRKAKERK